MMNGSFLGFGPGHWVPGVVLWLLIIVAFVAFYFALRKKARHDSGKIVQKKNPDPDLSGNKSGPDQ